MARKGKIIPQRVVIQNKRMSRTSRTLSNHIPVPFFYAQHDVVFFVLFFSFRFLLLPGILTHSPLDILPKERSLKLVESFSLFRYHAKKKLSFPIKIVI